MVLEFADTEQYRAFNTRYPNFDSSFDRIVALTNKVFGRRLDESDLLHDLVFSMSVP